MLAEFDVMVTQYVNSFATQWPAFDLLVLDVMQLASVKMLPIVACLVWFWFDGSDDVRRRRAVLDGLLGGLAALMLSRLIQVFSPHRPRPGLSPEFDFVQPVGGYVNDWSSFPSDTAALAFALVAAIWMASRPLGVAGLAWAVVVVCFPRLYGGFHYVSDLVAGGGIGAIATLLVARYLPFGDRLLRAAGELSRRRPSLFYTCAFVVAFQIATYFADPREVLSHTLSAVGALLWRSG